MRRLRYIFALAALAFFFTPLLLLAGGVRADAFENRALAERPSPKQGWDAFDTATQYLVDHMPLREQAVRINTWKSLNVFRTTPKYGRATNAMDEANSLPFTGGAAEPEAEVDPKDAPPATASQVLRGQDDWLYLQGELDRACSPFMEWRKAVAQWERLARVIRDSGREVVVVIAADKSTIYPEHLPEDLPQQECIDKGRTALWAALEGSSDPALVPLREDLLAARDEFEHRIYYKTDSHWNSAGASVLVREVVERVGPAPLDPREVVLPGTRKHAGDLGHMLGAPQEETVHDVEVRKPPGLRPKPGRTGYILDSYGMGAMGGLQDRYANFTWKSWATDQPTVIAKAIGQADTVIIETVEREVTFRASEVLTEQFFATLERELARRGS